MWHLCSSKTIITSWYEDAFRITGPLRGDLSAIDAGNAALEYGAWWCHHMETFFALLTIFEGNRQPPVDYPHKDQWRGALMFSLIGPWTKCWANNRDTGDLRSHRAHYDVTIMSKMFQGHLILVFGFIQLSLPIHCTPAFLCSWRVAIFIALARGNNGFELSSLTHTIQRSISWFTSLAADYRRLKNWLWLRTFWVLMRTVELETDIKENVNSSWAITYWICMYLYIKG